MNMDEEWESEMGDGRVFYFKLGRFVMSVIAWHTQGCPNLDLRTQPNSALLASRTRPWM
jgi:hypothetical protein